MTFPEILTRDSSGEIRLTGHRIGLFHVVHHYNEGYSPEMLAYQFPSLPLAMIHRVIAFYLENRAEVDAYVTSCRSQLSEQRAANPGRNDLQTLQQRREALQPSGRP